MEDETGIRSVRDDTTEQWHVFMISAGILAVLYVLFTVLKVKLSAYSGHVEPIGRMTAEASAVFVKIVLSVSSAVLPALLTGIAAMVLIAAMRFSFKRACLLWGFYIIYQIAALLWGLCFTDVSAANTGLYTFDCFVLLISALPIILMPKIFGRSIKETPRFILYTTVSAIWGAVVSFISGFIYVEFSQPMITDLSRTEYLKTASIRLLSSSLVGALKVFAYMLIVYGIVLVISRVKDKKHVEN